VDLIDNQLLNIIQKDFPIDPKPFETIANILNITEDEVLLRVEKLKKEGSIRRLGGIFDSKKLGYVSTLCAVKVQPEKLEEVAAYINTFNEVTHNYLRDYEFNIWFTLIAYSRERIQEILESIQSKFNDCIIINLPAKNLFKINVNLNVGGD
jgi:siroheme decarboxylase